MENLECIPYLSLTNGDEIYLPSIFVDISTGSNGMCAGNSPAEAIMQGLCEIYERHVLNKIHYNSDITLPSIPDWYLRNTNQ